MPELTEIKNAHEKDYPSSEVKLFSSEVSFSYDVDMLIVNTTYIEDHQRQNFHFQTKSPLPVISSPMNAEILFLEDALIINSLDQHQLLYLSLSSVECPQTLTQLPSTSVLKGFGLGEFAVPEGVTTREAAKPKCKCRDIGENAEDCTGGGENSTACSLGNEVSGPHCSVRCEGFSFACCWYEEN